MIIQVYTHLIDFLVLEVFFSLTLCLTRYAAMLCILCLQDLVKSHLMYAVREEVEVLKEQIKELIERNSQLEQENNLLKNLASPEQLAQFQAQVQSGSPPSSMQGAQPSAMPVQQLPTQNSGPSV